MFNFGNGTLWTIPNSQNLAANPTPMKCGTLQDISVDFAGDVKELYGQYQFADDVTRGKIKVSGKAKYGRINTKVINDSFFGQALGTGTKTNSLDESQSIPGTPYQVTVTNAATYVEDLGVRYSTTGKPLVKVASAPAQGQYSVNTSTGVYTFAAADTLAVVLISYTYTQAAVGSQLNIKNQLMGFTPKCELFLAEAYNGDQMNLRIYSAIFSKLMWAPKMDDYTTIELDFQACANAAGQIFDWYMSQATE